MASEEADGENSLIEAVGSETLSMKRVQELDYFSGTLEEISPSFKAMSQGQEWLAASWSPLMVSTGTEWKSIHQSTAMEGNRGESVER